MDTLFALVLFSFGLHLPVSEAQLQVDNPGDLRLVGNFGATTGGRGRLEIYANNEWGTICDDNFGATEAILACNQLGFNSYSRYGNVVSLSYPQVSSSSTSIWNLQCSFSDLTISECSRSTSSLFSCSHAKDVAIECLWPYPIQSSSLRLVTKNGVTTPHLTAGRVEVFYAGKWGTICSDGFSSADAQALCYNLTGSSTILTYGTTMSQYLQFSQASSASPVWLEDLRCPYSSFSLRYTYPCRHDGIGITDCTHSKDIAVSCRADGAVRLVSSSFTPLSSSLGSYTGRLEIYYSGSWGTICDDSFDQADADVVCRQLGYVEASRYGNVEDLGYTRGTGNIWLTNIACTSTDVFLANCSHSGFGDAPFCSHSEDVAITCTRDTSITSNVADGTVRLISFSYTPSTTYRGGSAGRLEIYYSGEWGTVCDDLFSQSDANVVCRQLGYGRTAYRYGNVGTLRYTRGSSSSPIWLTNVGCTSRDTRLANCSHSGFGNTRSCSHSEDVAIKCTSDDTEGTTTYTSSSIGGGIGGFFACCCYFWICFGFCNSSSRSSRSHRTTTAPRPPTTRVVSQTTARSSSQPNTAAAAAIVMVAVRTEETFDSKQKPTAPPAHHLQAQTYNGEAPPDYSEACNYPKVDY